MANDGSIKIGVDLDTITLKKQLNGISGAFSKGLTGITNFAKAGMTAIAGVSASVGGLGIAIGKVGMDFEAQMSRVGAISGATASELELLENKAKEMGATTQFSATESAEALEYMALAGWKTDDMLNGLSGVMNLAAASGEDLGLVSDIVTDGLSAFGLAASDSAKFADVLAATSSNANTNVSMLGESFKYVAPVAGALGYSIEDTSVALGLMANAGIKASSSGTALRTLMTNLASPTSTSAKAISDLGLSITDASGNMLPFNDVILQLRDSFSTLGEAEKAQYAEMLAGKEGMSGLLAIVNASQADFDKLSGAINNSTGSAEKMAKTMNDNLAGSLKVLKSTLEGIALSLYEELQTPLKDITKYITEMLSNLQQAFNEGGIDGLISALGGTIGKLLTDIAAKAPQFLQIGINIIQSLLNGIGQNSTAIGESAATIITTLINGIFTLLPTVIDVGADLIINFQQGLIANLPMLIETGKQILENISSSIIENLPLIVENANEITMQIVNALINNLPLIINTAIEMILALVDGWVGTLPELIPACIEAILTIVEALIDNLDKIIDAAIELIVALADGLIQALPILIEKVPVIITKLVTALIQPEMLIKLVDVGLRLILSLIEGIMKSVVSVGQAAWDIGKTILNKILEFPKDMIEAGKDLIKGLIKGIKSMASEVFNTLKDFCGGIIDDVKSFFGIHSPSRLFRDEVGKMLVQGMIVGVENESDNLVESLVAPYDEASSEIDKKASQLESQYVGISPFGIENIDSNEITKAEETLVKNVEGTFMAVKNILISNVTETTSIIIDFLKTQIDNLQNEFLNKLLEILPPQLENIGFMTITGFESGLTSRMGAILVQVKNFADDVVNEMQRALDIHSPSRKMKWLGQMTMAGYDEGISKSAKGTLSKINNLPILESFKNKVGYVKSMVSNFMNSIIPKSITSAVDKPNQNITNNGGDVNIYVDKMELREKEDINRIAQEIATLINSRNLAKGVV